jgi:hypothetical protein
VEKDRRLVNLSTPITVQKLQRALHAKAKAEASYRFYALYDKLYREDILAHAYAQCRSNKGAPGVDYLVNFRSVQTPLNDQFSIGANREGFTERQRGSGRRAECASTIGAIALGVVDDGGRQ